MSTIQDKYNEYLDARARIRDARRRTTAAENAENEANAALVAALGKRVACVKCEQSQHPRTRLVSIEVGKHGEIVERMMVPGSEE